MSVDKSLRSRSVLERHRNVLSRAERISILKDTGLWTGDSTALGLPKVAHRKAAVGKKSKAEKSTESATGTEAAAPADAKPADKAGAKPAAEKDKKK